MELEGRDFPGAQRHQQAGEEKASDLEVPLLACKCFVCITPTAPNRTSRCPVAIHHIAGDRRSLPCPPGPKPPHRGGFRRRLV